MQRTLLLRQTYVVAGIWLIISPFLFSSQNSLLRIGNAMEAMILMSFGLFALIIAGLNSRRPYIVMAGLGILLASMLMSSPLIFEFRKGGVAELSAGIVGLAVLVIVLFNFTGRRIGRAM